MVCPMRVFLVLASTFVAGYLAWLSWNKQGPVLVDADASAQETGGSRTSEKVWQSVRGKAQLAFDMVSGRYLYEQWKSLRKPAKVGPGKID